MRLAVKLLDHIFSFLISEPRRETLFACSKDPVLSSIADKHFYSSIIVDVSTTPEYLNDRYTFKLDRFSKLVAENPRILNYVRVLQIDIDFKGSRGKEAVVLLFDKFTKTLPMFLVLSSIILTSSHAGQWAVFLAILEDRLGLPTLQELHLVGSVQFPFSLLNDWKSIKRDSSQRTSLSLELDVANSPYYNYFRDWRTIDVSPKLSPVSLNVQRLTIRTRTENNYQTWRTWLPATAEIIKSFVSSPPRHLVLDIAISLNDDEDVHDLFAVDFSPLAVLGAASLVIPRIDLYVHTGGRLESDATHTSLLGSLAQYEGIMRAIEEGVLVIHSEETAPVSKRIV